MQQNMHYTAMPQGSSAVDQSYAQQQNTFPTPPLQHGAPHDSSPGAYSQDSYNQHDLADLLGSLKVNEAGTGEFLLLWVSFVGVDVSDNSASSLFKQQDAPENRGIRRARTGGLG